MSSSCVLHAQSAHCLSCVPYHSILQSSSLSLSQISHKQNTQTKIIKFTKHCIRAAFSNHGHSSTHIKIHLHFFKKEKLIHIHPSIHPKVSKLFFCMHPHHPKFEKDLTQLTIQTKEGYYIFLSSVSITVMYTLFWRDIHSNAFSLSDWLTDWTRK